MIRGEAMREKIKSLWKLCFNDSDEFTDMYFRLRYSNESTSPFKAVKR